MAWVLLDGCSHPWAHDVEGQGQHGPSVTGGLSVLLYHMASCCPRHRRGLWPMRWLLCSPGNVPVLQRAFPSVFSPIRSAQARPAALAGSSNPLTCPNSAIHTRLGTNREPPTHPTCPHSQQIPSGMSVYDGAQPTPVENSIANPKIPRSCRILSEGGMVEPTLLPGVPRDVGSPASPLPADLPAPERPHTRDGRVW